MKKLFIALLSLLALTQVATAQPTTTKVPLPVIDVQAANTVVGNATSGSASPTALSVGNCSTASSALNWTTNTGFGCNTSITAAVAPASGLTGTVALTNGGTAASLTASNGGIVYSNASTLAILAGTVTAGQCLLSGSSAAPTWGSCSGAAAVSSVANSDSTLTISPTTGSVIASLNLAHANTWTAVQTFTNSDLALLGSSTGFTTFTSDNAGASNFTMHVPASNNTLVTLSDTQTLTNKSISGPQINSGVVGATYGGTGVNNGSNTITLGGNLITSGAFNTTFTVTGTTASTLPAGTHTLAGLDVTQTWSGTQTFGTVLGTVTTQSGTTYTLTSSDCGTMVRGSNASAITFTIPATLPIGCNIAIEQALAGQISVNGSAVTPATLQSAHSYTKTFGQWAIIGITIETNSGGSSAVAVLTGDGA